MSDEPTPELRALAEQLFAAGRAERPGPALGRRLLLIEPAPPASEPRAPHGGLEPRAPAPRWRGARSFWLGASAVAAMAAASVGLWASLGQGPVIDMSPDPVSARPRPVHAVPAPSERGAVTTLAPAEPVARDGDGDAPRAEPPARAPVRSRKPNAREAVQVSPAPAPAAAPATPSPKAEAPVAAASEPAPAVLALSEEIALLKQARVALRAGDAARALDVLDRHARARSADGLNAEATLLRIEALDALGRRAEASRLAARFVHENPFNALADRAKRFVRPSGAGP